MNANECLQNKKIKKKQENPFYEGYANVVFRLKAPQTRKLVGCRITRINCGPPTPWLNVFPDSRKANCFSIGSGKLCYVVTFSCRDREKGNICYEN